MRSVASEFLRNSTFFCKSTPSAATVIITDYCTSEFFPLAALIRVSPALYVKARGFSGR